ncbi:membrane hypothetical protein [Rhodospirillaceae bacterium LM-1]|nr:membrane hypothetical protein [Rhodospirillaceae bacterium LM-1]
MGFVILIGAVFALAAIWFVFSLAHTYLQGVISSAWLTPGFLIFLILISSLALKDKGPRKEIFFVTSLPFAYLGILYVLFPELTPFILDPNTATGGWAFTLAVVPSFLVLWIMHLDRKLRKSADSEG